MATREQLRTWIREDLLDESFSDDRLNSLIDEAIYEIAGRVLLPMCETSASITTVQFEHELSLPSDFHRELYGCSFPGEDTPTVLTTVAHLRERYPNFEVDSEFGSPEFVTTRAGNLVYFPIPYEATVGQINYYRTPILLTTERSAPSDIPERFQRKLITSYVLMECFDIIEDGIDGQKANTQRYASKFEMALIDLRDSLPTGQSRRMPPNDLKEWF